MYLFEVLTEILDPAAQCGNTERQLKKTFPPLISSDRVNAGIGPTTTMFPVSVVTSSTPAVGLLMPELWHEQLAGSK